jgi:hypothetical protein
LQSPISRTFGALVWRAGAWWDGHWHPRSDLSLSASIQSAIDKRFYRRKYDAVKVLAAIGATMRDETDLERLTAAMLRVVDETMQPEHISVWLRPSGWKRNHQQDKNNDFSKGGTP